MAYIVDEVCKTIVKNLGPVCLKVPSSTAALPFSFFFYLRRDRLHFLRRVIENFPNSSYHILTSTRNAHGASINNESLPWKVSLVGMRVFNSVEHGGQTNATVLFTLKNKRNIGWCWRRCLIEIKLRSISSNFTQHRATWWPNECNMFDSTMLDDVVCINMLDPFGQAFKP